MTNLRVFLAQMARAVWFRASLFSLAAVLLALAAGFLEPFLPDLTVNLGQGSVDEILQILASSMLAVTTFSLTAMVTALVDEQNLLQSNSGGASSTAGVPAGAMQPPPDLGETRAQLKVD